MFAALLSILGKIGGSTAGAATAGAATAAGSQGLFSTLGSVVRQGAMSGIQSGLASGITNSISGDASQGQVGRLGQVNPNLFSGYNSGFGILGQR